MHIHPPPTPEGSDDQEWEGALGGVAGVGAGGEGLLRQVRPRSSHQGPEVPPSGDLLTPPDPDQRAASVRWRVRGHLTCGCVTSLAASGRRARGLRQEPGGGGLLDADVTCLQASRRNRTHLLWFHRSGGGGGGGVGGVAADVRPCV